MDKAKAIIDYAMQDNGTGVRDALYAGIQDRVMAHIEAKKQEVALSMLVKPEEQTDVVGVKVINALNDQNKEDSVTFLDKDEKPNIKKSYADIIGPAEGGGENAKKAAEVLGKIKQDEDKMGKVVKFAEFIQDDKNKDKVAEIEKMLGGEGE